MHASFPLQPIMAIDATALPSLRDGSFARAAKPVETPIQSDVSIVDVAGPLAQNAFSFFGLVMVDGYDAIANRFAAALADKKTSAVVLRLNSPGGDVAGLFEAVRAMRAAKAASGKPVVAYADEFAASAAYAIATVADRIVVPETGRVGSVGVIATMASMSRALEDDGIDVEVVASGDQKTDGHPAVPISKDAVARLRADVTTLAGMFAREVASARGVTSKAVLDLQAGVFMGSKAVDAKLADQVGGLDAAMGTARGLGAARSASTSKPAASVPDLITSWGPRASAATAKSQREQDLDDIERVYPRSRAAAGKYMSPEQISALASKARLRRGDRAAGEARAASRGTSVAAAPSGDPSTWTRFDDFVRAGKFRELARVKFEDPKRYAALLATRTEVP